jgi:hypothetical protein
VVFGIEPHWGYPHRSTSPTVTDERGRVMKKFKLPKEQLVEPEQGSREGDAFIDGQDVEGHGLPITAPPSFDVQRRTQHGGEILPTDTDDTETE